MKAKIDGEVVEVVDTYLLGCLPQIILNDGQEYNIASDSEKAGEAARKRWEELAQDDPQEFAAIVGEKVLVAWALGQCAGPGSGKVSSLDEWLDLFLETPEEEWAGYDGQECEFETSDQGLADDLGLEPSENGTFHGVAYRWN